MLLPETGIELRKAIRKYMTIDATIHAAGDEKVQIHNALLLDSGSLDAGYVSTELLAEHPNVALKQENNHSRVLFAGSGSEGKCNKRILLDIELEYLDGRRLRFKSWYGVIDITMKVILGLPQLCLLPPEFFTERYTEAVRLLCKDSASRPLHKRRAYEVDPREELKATSEIDYVEGELYEPWSERIPEAPEETFGDDQLNFMEVEPSAALEQYMADLEKYKDLPPPKPGEERMAPLGLFSNHEGFLQYMRETGHKVFVPQNWDGIKGVPEIDLKFDDTLPKSHYARGRPPPKQYEENARKGIKRLLQYMYVRSNAPHMSDNHWALKATEPFVRLTGRLPMDKPTHTNGARVHTYHTRRAGEAQRLQILLRFRPH